MIDVKRAPLGQFRIIGKDTPRDLGWVKADYLTLNEAIKIVSSASGKSKVQYFVYNDVGECCFPKK